MTVMPAPTEPRLARSPEQAEADPKEPKGKEKKDKKKKDKGEAADGEAPKKKKTPMIIGLVVVLALVGLKEKGMFIKPHYTTAHPAPNGEIYPLANTSPFTVTTSDGHTVETNVALQLTTVASAKALGKVEPAIENDVIDVLGAMTYAELLPASGRQAAANEILQDVQKLLGPVDGSPQVSGVLFTGSFVLQ